MKYSTTDCDSPSIIRGSCFLSTNIIIMNCQTSKQGFLKPKSSMNFCTPINGTSRQYHTQVNCDSSEINKMVIQTICQPIAEVLTYAQAVKADKRLPKPIDFNMKIASVPCQATSTFQIPQSTLQNLANLNIKSTVMPIISNNNLHKPYQNSQKLQQNLYKPPQKNLYLKLEKSDQNFPNLHKGTPQSPIQKNRSLSPKSSQKLDQNTVKFTSNRNPAYKIHQNTTEISQKSTQSSSSTPKLLLNSQIPCEFPQNSSNSLLSTSKVTVSPQNIPKPLQSTSKVTSNPQIPQNIPKPLQSTSKVTSNSQIPCKIPQNPPKPLQSTSKVTLNPQIPYKPPQNTPKPSPSTSHIPPNLQIGNKLPQNSSKSTSNHPNSRCPWRKPTPITTPTIVISPYKVPEKKSLFERRTITSPTLNKNKWKFNNNNTAEKKSRVYQKSQNKFWQKTPNILNCSWRTPNLPKECSITKMNSDSSNNKMCEIKNVQQQKEEGQTAGLDCRLICRDRRQSESSLTSEDSFVVFDRDSGCSYESEISSCESSDAEESESEGEESTLSDSSISSVSHVHDSGLTSDSEDESHTLQVGESRLSLPPRQPVPPARTSSSSSCKSSMSDTDSDDDFIVFGSEDEESCDESDIGESEVDGYKPRSDIKVRFAEKEEICYFYDDDDARQARCGEWEEMARDRSRFKARINGSNEILGPILTSEHRDKVFQRLYNNKNSINNKS